jgi:hypothetical protein
VKDGTEGPKEKEPEVCEEWSDRIYALLKVRGTMTGQEIAAKVELSPRLVNLILDNDVRFERTGCGWKPMARCDVEK